MSAVRLLHELHRTAPTGPALLDPDRPKRARGVDPFGGHPDLGCSPRKAQAKTLVAALPDTAWVRCLAGAGTHGNGVPGCAGVGLPPRWIG